jgi:hypothetical protein
MLQVLLVLIVIGVLLWLACNYIPMDATIKKIIVAVAIICVVVWLLQVFGLLGLANVPVPRVHN